MSGGESGDTLARAVAVAEEMVRVADGDDPERLLPLEAELRRLLDAARTPGAALDRDGQAAIDAIRVLNDRALGLVEHRLRRLGREIDTISAGRRAVRAYALTGSQR